MDIIFNLFKIKFRKLDELIEKHCSNIDCKSQFNIFINLDPIINKLSSSKIDEYLKVKKDRSFEFISNIINLAAHYRLFFTKNKVYSKVYIYMGTPSITSYKNHVILPNYRSYYNHKYSKDPNNFILNSTMSEIIPFTKIILEYVEGVYLIQSEHIESSLVPHIITKSNDTNSNNFIVTTDRYDYQYTCKDFYIIRPKRDESYIITKESLINEFKLENKITNELQIDYMFYPFILSILGDKYRSIEKIKRIGLSTIIKMMCKAIDIRIIGKNVYNINILSNLIKDEYKELLIQNYNCTDLDSQLQLLNIKDLYTITSQILDKFDNVSLRKLNDQYFINNPLMLMELVSATKLITKQTKTNIFK